MDLMSSNEHYEYRELARKYGNFLQPAFQIQFDPDLLDHVCMVIRSFF